MTKRTAYIMSELIEIEFQGLMEHFTKIQCIEKLTALWDFCKDDEKKDFAADFADTAELLKIER